jgi:O-antigen/teichoic acid export membrane protein
MAWDLRARRRRSRLKASVLHAASERAPDLGDAANDADIAGGMPVGDVVASKSSRALGGSRGTLKLRDHVSRSLHVTPLALATAISLANSLVLAIVYARIGGPDSYGIFQMTVATTGVVAVIALSGATTAATRAAAQGRRAAWLLFKSRLRWCGAASGVLLLVALIVLDHGQSALAAALATGALALPLFIGGDLYPAHLIGDRRYRRYLGFQLTTQTVTLLGVALAVVIAPSEPWIAALAYMGSIGVIQLRGLMTLRAGADATPEDLSYARRFTGVSVLSAVDARLDVLLTGFLLSPSAAGTVAVARTFPGLLKAAWTVAYQPLFVKMTAMPLAEAYRVVSRYRLAVVAALASLSAIGAVIVVWLVPALFGKEYDDAVPLAQLLLLASGLASLGYVDQTFIRAQGFVLNEAIILTALPIFSLVVLPLLILAVGINGVGIKAVLATLLQVALATMIARRVVRAATSR